jgi:hypothetical protein
MACKYHNCIGHNITTLRKAGTFHCGAYRQSLARAVKAGIWVQGSLKGQHDAIALWVLLLVDVDLAVNHGHDAIPELWNENSRFFSKLARTYKKTACSLSRG